LEGSILSIILKLRYELDRLKMLLNYGHELEVRWMPNGGSDKLGEVRGDVIYIYAVEENDALRSLRHEFIDYYISREVIEPLLKYINLQKRLIEDLIYDRKEFLVNNVVRVLK